MPVIEPTAGLKLPADEHAPICPTTSFQPRIFETIRTWLHVPMWFTMFLLRASALRRPFASSAKRKLQTRCSTNGQRKVQAGMAFGWGC